MESTPLLENAKNTQRSKIGNLLKANLIFLIFHLATNVRSPVLNQYLYQRYVGQLQPDNTSSVSANDSSSCYVNKSDPSYVTRTEAEEMSNNIQVIMGYIANPLCVFSCVFLGAYSDYIGRKMLFVIPLIGETIRNALCTAIMYWDWELKYMYVGSAITGITGGFYGLILASYTYSADNTPTKTTRTMGIAAVEFTSYFAAGLSQAGTGYFIQYTGFMYPSLVTVFLMLLAILLVIALLPETVPEERKLQPCIPLTQAVKNVFGFYFSKTLGKKLSFFWVVLLAFFLTYLCDFATGTIDYMLILNQPFCWGPEKIGYFFMADVFLKQFLGIGILRLMQVCTSDEMFAILASLLQAGANILHGVAYTDFMLYATIVLEGFTAALLPVIRSIMSHMAPGDLQGSLFAGQIVVSIISYSIGSGLSGVIYDATIQIQRGFVYYVSAATNLMTAGVLVVLLCLIQKRPANLTPDNDHIN